MYSTKKIPKLSHQNIITKSENNSAYTIDSIKKPTPEKDWVRLKARNLKSQTSGGVQYSNIKDVTENKFQS